MALPLYLAMTAAEMEASADLPRHLGWMACHFSPAGRGLCDLPDALPPGAMLILNDRLPCRDHDPAQVAAELAEAVERLGCGSVLLDFERKPGEIAMAVAEALFQTLPCPVAAPPEFTKDSSHHAVFLPPCPLHVPLAEYLQPWQGRDIWLEGALQRQTVTVTPAGTRFSPAAPAGALTGGHWDETLQCRVLTEITDEAARFTLFDTAETLPPKWHQAEKMGVSRIVGLHQELAGIEESFKF